MSDLLAVIPARGGSKGIPGKALRSVGGVPSILRTLRTVERSGVASEMVVSTDCPKIKSFCELRGYPVIDRPAELAMDDTPLFPVARHAALFWNGVTEWEGDVGIFQPTCPLIRPETLKSVYEEWRHSKYDWAITVAEDRHLHWRAGKQLDKRVNRQYRAPMYRESGAFQLISNDYLETKEGIEGMIPIPARQALDIDVFDDLLLAEHLVRAGHIHFVVAAGRQVGTGHYHRSIALAKALGHHDLSWEWRGDPDDDASNQVKALTHGEGMPNLTIFDCLTPSEDELIAARSIGPVVVLEDETEGSRRYADLLVNDMLSLEDVTYAVLREEFLCLPKRQHREIADRVLITFGGSDPADLTKRCSELLDEDYEVRVITPSVDVQMAEEMRSADLVITGQGRTVLEAAACGTPTISIAANEREARHVRIPGITYLGLHSTVTDDTIRATTKATLASQNLRSEKSSSAGNLVDGRGLDRLVRRIEDLLI